MLPRKEVLDLLAQSQVGEMGESEDIWPGPQSCERMLGAKLQVRPVPSGSTFSAFTTPLLITMENLPERDIAAAAQAAARALVPTGGRGGAVLYLFSRRFPKRDTRESSNSKSVS